MSSSAIKQPVLQDLSVREIVLRLQSQIADPEPYLSGKCLTFAAAAGIACANAGLNIPTINIIFRDEFDANDMEPAERFSRTLSHCTIEEFGGTDDYDVTCLSDAAENWEGKWDLDAVDKWGMYSEFDIQTIDPQSVSDLISALTSLGEKYSCYFNALEASSLASLASADHEECLSPGM